MIWIILFYYTELLFLENLPNKSWMNQWYWNKLSFCLYTLWNVFNWYKYRWEPLYNTRPRRAEAFVHATSYLIYIFPFGISRRCPFLFWTFAINRHLLSGIKYISSLLFKSLPTTATEKSFPFFFFPTQCPWTAYGYSYRIMLRSSSQELPQAQLSFQFQSRWCD